MRTRQVYHRDGELIEIITKLRGGPRRSVQLICLAFIVASGLMWQYTPENRYWFNAACFAAVLIPLGWGEFGHLILPNGRIRTRLRLFGIPTYQTTTEASRFSSCELIQEEEGDFTLRFFGAGGTAQFTLEGIPDEEIALRVANLVPKADNQQDLAAEHAIQDIHEANKGGSPIYVFLMYLLVFPIGPIAAFVVGRDMVIIPFVIGVGVVLVSVISIWTRKSGGVHEVSREGGYVDRWDRKGLFHAIDYRHHLGEEPVIEIADKRFDPSSLTVLVMPALQAVVIGIVVVLSGEPGPTWMEEENARADAELQEVMRQRAEAQSELQQDQAAPGDMTREEAINKGMDLFLEHKRRKEAEEREAAEQAE